MVKYKVIDTCEMKFLKSYSCFESTQSQFLIGCAEDPQDPSFPLLSPHNNCSSILGTSQALILNGFSSLHSCWKDASQLCSSFFAASARCRAFCVCQDGNSSIMSFHFFLLLIFLSPCLYHSLNFILVQYLFARHHQSFY